MANVLLDGMEGLLGSLGGDGDPTVDDNVRGEWNKFVDWMAAKGVKGKPELDTNQLGFKYLDDYIKENPNTVLSRELVLPIQREFQTYRTKALENIKAGKAKFDGTEEQFMPGLSKLDGYPGQFTTNYKFPSESTTFFVDGKQTGKTTKPFAKP